MKLYLARHGQTEWNRLGYYSGQLDEPMNETGRRQIEALARRWQEDVDQIWSSPLSRAVQTAEILRGDRDASVPLLLEPLLLESDFGSWAGKSWTQIADTLLWISVALSMVALIWYAVDLMKKLGTKADSTK